MKEILKPLFGGKCPFKKFTVLMSEKLRLGALSKQLRLKASFKPTA